MTAATDSRDAGSHEGHDLPVVPVRHPGRWVTAVVILVVLAQVIHWGATDPKLNWHVFRRFLFSSAVMTGVERTLELTVLAMLVGIALGIVLAVMRLSDNPIVSGFAWVYVWFFRGTPVIVQLLFWANIPAILQGGVGFGIPFGPTFFSGNPNAVITLFVAALLGLGLNEAAYMAEIARAGILSVDEGQSEAAAALGMTRMQTMRRIVLPQAMRVIIPPTGNETISMLKTTSLVIVIGYAELLTTVQIIYARTFQVIPMLLVASFWYIVFTSVLSIGQYYLERRFARGSSRALPPTPLQRVRARLGRKPIAPARQEAPPLPPASSQQPLGGGL